jgi:3'(2'), 5'-bisphosphate nucleotidase
MYEREKQVAIQSVVDACRLCRAVQASLISDDTLAKKDKSPVTVADYGAQAIVSASVAAALPDDPLVAEEDAAALRDPANAAIAESVIAHVQAIRPVLDRDAILTAIDRGRHSGGATGRFWTLDPIDGTKGFLRGDQYAVALALLEDGRIVVAALGCPNLPVDAKTPDGPRGCLFVAVHGEGAIMQPLDGGPAAMPIHVDAIHEPAQAVFCESVESAHSSHGDAAKIAARLSVAAEPFRIDSQCKYAAIARGDASIYLRLPTRGDYEERIWDHAAGWLIVAEAGGRVTDVRGNDLDFTRGRTLSANKGVVATNAHVHDRVITAVREVLKI